MATDTLTSRQSLRHNPSKVFKNFIDGEWVESSTGETFEDRNPADTRDVVGIFQQSNKADVEPPSMLLSAPSPSGGWSPPRAAPKSSSAPPKF